MSLTKDNVTKRQAQTEQEMGKVALERVRLTQRIEELDKILMAMQAVAQANTFTLKDLDTEAAIEAAKAQEVNTDE